MTGRVGMVGPLLLALLFATPARAERRLALLVGENTGDREDPPLRYAESDAEAMRDVLVRVGGVAAVDATLLHGADAADLRAGLAGVAQRLAHDGFGKSDLLIL